MGCFTFGPEHIQSPDIWSPTIGPQEQTILAHLVPIDKWSPKQLVPLDNWSPWTIGPQNLLVHTFQKRFRTLFSIFWHMMDITNDFKPIFKMFFLFWWNKTIIILIFFKNIFKNFLKFSFAKYTISNWKKMKKCFFVKKKKELWFFYFTKT